MSIWTCERKLHHSPSKKEMHRYSEGNLHFVCIKRWEYIWTHQTTILGPISHTHILSCTFWKFLLSVARPIKVSGLLWVGSVLTLLISWAANAGLTNVFEFLCYRSPDSCRGRVDAGKERICMNAPFSVRLDFQSFHWLLVLTDCWFCTTYYSFILFSSD